MQINYYPGRIRLRDPALRDEEIRNAAENVVRKACVVKNITFNPTTSSVLFEYEQNSIPVEEKLKKLIPLGISLQSKLKFYTPKKKAEILSLISKAEEMLQ